MTTSTLQTSSRSSSALPMVKSPPVINRRRKRKNDELAEEDRASELLNKAVGHMDSVRRNMAITKSMDDCSAFGHSSSPPVFS